MTKHATDRLKQFLVRWPLWITLTMFAVAMGFAFSRQSASGDFLLSEEDAYQRMMVARNLVTHLSWGINPGEFTSSFGTLLWPVLLAPIFLLLGANAVWPWLLNLILSIVFIILAYRVVWKWIANPIWQALFLLVWMMALPVAPLAAMGMEHVLFLLILLVFLKMWFHRMESPAHDSLRPIGMIAILLSCTRYEGWLVVVLAGLLLLLRRDYLAALVLPSVAVIPLVTYGLISWQAGWLPIPASVFLRRAELIPGDLVQIPAVILRPLEVLDSRADLRVLALLVALLLTWFGWTGRFSSLRVREFYASALTVLAGTAYLFLIGSQGYRYDAWLILLAGWAVLPLFKLVLSNDAGCLHRNKVMTCAGGILVLLLIFPLLSRSVQGMAQLDESVQQAQKIDLPAVMLVSHCTSGPIASDAPGRIAFLTGRPVVDLSGFGSPEAFQERRANMVRKEWMKEEVQKQSASVAVLFDRDRLEKASSIWTWLAGWWMPGKNSASAFAGILQVQEIPGLTECIQNAEERLPEDVLDLNPAILAKIP